MGFTNLTKQDYFIMAQKITVYTDDFRNLNKPILNDCVVLYDDIKYYPRYLRAGFNADGTQNIVAILHDLKTNCEVYADLDKVVKYGT